MSNTNKLETLYQQYIYKSRYSRWLESEGRREQWPETVNRYVNFYKDKFPLASVNWSLIRESILNLEVMPSMRALMTAGEAADRTNVCTYNCAYVSADYQEVFRDILYILMCGTGVGFSVERQAVDQLPVVPKQWIKGKDKVVVEDSKEGWAKAFALLVDCRFKGIHVELDVSNLRLAGARLKTFGGRSSGPAPLVALAKFTHRTFDKAAGRQLTSIEVHDLICKIADVVVVGGVRRSALISLSTLCDERMRNAKSGQWWDGNVQRALANNSAVYTEKPEAEIWMQEFLSMVQSKSGERGLFNRSAVKSERLETYDKGHGTNPCSEIQLRSKQFCNLTEIVARPYDTNESLLRKATVAAQLGTLQAALTNFPLIDPEWQSNCEEEALLGVSITGIADSAEQLDTLMLDMLNSRVRETNALVAKSIGINTAAAFTCVKPSGTVSQLVNSSSGIHDRYAPYYIRTVRADNNDPLTNFLKDQGIPNEPDITKPDNTTIFSFPIASPSGSSQLTSIAQLERWKKFKRNWADHSVSVTIHYEEDEIFDIASWVFKNFDIISGISFLPKSDHVYLQPPYQKISKEQYLEALNLMPSKLDWDAFNSYEAEDNTSGAQQLACSAGICPI